jgi:hypothetical protein
MSRIWNSLFSDGTSKAWVIFTALLTFAANGGVTLYLVNRSESHNESMIQEQLAHSLQAAEKAEFNERSREIRASAEDFSTYAAAYVSAVVEAPDGIPVARKRLTENVIKQLSTVSMGSSIFHGDVAKAAEEYENALYEFREALIHADSVMEMRPFWESASDVLVARDRLLKAVDKLG